MADVQLWEGGSAQVVGVDCGGCKENNCPAPHRMAAHRRRSPYIMGGAFDPLCDQRNRDCYCQLEVGDTVWLALVPEDSLLEYTRVKVVDGDAGGLVFSVVAEEITLDDCAVIGAANIGAGLTGLVTTACLAVFAVPPAALYSQPCPGGDPTLRRGYRVGIQVDTLPAGGVCNYQGRIELSVYARDFETVQIADCRLNGSCVINNP